MVQLKGRLEAPSNYILGYWSELISNGLYRDIATQNVSHFQLHCRNWNNFVSFTFHHFTIYVQQFKKVTIQCFHIPNWEIYDLLSLNSIHMSTNRQWKRGNYCIQAHPSLIQHKKPCNTTHKILSLVDLTPKSTLGPRLRAGSHGVPSPKSQVCWGQCMQFIHWEHGIWDLPLHTRSQVMDAHMATLCGGETQNLCWELGRIKS